MSIKKETEQSFFCLFGLNMIFNISDFLYYFQLNAFLTNYFPNPGYDGVLSQISIKEKADFG